MDIFIPEELRIEPEAAQSTVPADIPDLQAVLDAWVEKSIAIGGPARSNHASAIGHPCARHLAYRRVVNPTDKHNVRLERIFRLGEYHGKRAARELAEAFDNHPQGFEVVQAENPVPPNQWEIGGREDVWLVKRRGGKAIVRYPVEVKSMGEFGFQSIKSLHDILRHPYIYIRKWYSQIQTYMGLEKATGGYLLITNRGTGQYKSFYVPFDQPHFEKLLARCDEVNKAVRQYSIAGEMGMPQRIAYSGNVCGDCEYRSACCPDMVSNGETVNLLWDAELEAYLSIMDSLEEQAAEYEDAAAKVKAHCNAALLRATDTPLTKGETRTIVTAGHTIVCKCSEGTNYVVPENMKPFCRNTYTYIRQDIKKAGLL